MAPRVEGEITCLATETVQRKEALRVLRTCFGIQAINRTHITALYEMTVSVRRHADAGVPKVSSPLLP